MSEEKAESLSTNMTHLDYPVIIESKPLWEIVVKTVFYVPIISLAIIGNVLVILVVARNKRMRTTTNYYIVNLAVADCLVALTCSWVHLLDDLTPGWVLGAFFCKFNTFTQGQCPHHPAHRLDVDDSCIVPMLRHSHINFLSVAVRQCNVVNILRSSYPNIAFSFMAT
ncbi:hypothetical protein BaRGS_00032880 [Batillaria attramentaria]|uniref:G-protein coupled receptors family 1 profile domain-containing protein n=1 Tax=Batillaria attramentaria TaxID=370345 RepID=A0ABD0JM61_9CAEN